MTTNAHANVTAVDDTSFDEEVLASDLPVLVDFGATWCAPCRALAPIVGRLADESAGRFKVVMLDADESPAVAKRYGVRAMPTLLVFRKGEKVASHLGVATREKLLALLAG
jgi:thioredoxin 1